MKKQSFLDSDTKLYEEIYGQILSGAMDYKLEEFCKFSDKRGDLIVFLDETQLADTKKKFGQIYFVTFKKKGLVRGNHYHKKWHEWFGVVAGKVYVVLEDVRTKERAEFMLNANTKDRYMRLQIGPYIAHSFKSLTNYAALLNYADAPWRFDDDFDYELI